MSLDTARGVTVVGLLLLLAGCASGPERLDVATLSKIRNVAVMSLAAHEFERRYTGFTVLGNEYENRDIAEWKVDDQYEAQIQAVLGTLTRFKVARPAYERTDFYRVYELDGPWDAPAFRTPKWSAVEQPLKAFAQKNALDAIIVIVRTESPDVLAQTNQYMRGAGFYARGFGDSTSVSVLHLLAIVSLIDGNTGKPIAARRLARSYDRWASTMLRIGAIENIPATWSRAKLGQWDEKAVREIRERLVDLPKDSWKPTLGALLATDGN
jgi:hypothetical protein